MISDEWLEKLQVGDRVCVTHSYGRRFRIEKAAKVTKTQIVTEPSGMRFNRRTGRQTGDHGYGGSSLREWTPERQAEFNIEYAQEFLRHVVWSKVKPEALQTIVGIVKANQIPEPK